MAYEYKILPDANKNAAVLPVVNKYGKILKQQPITTPGSIEANEEDNIATGIDYDKAEVVQPYNYGDKPFTTLFGTPQAVPLRIKLATESDYWLFPIEPLITIEGKNSIVKRNVAKKRDGGGTIKEYWTQDDWSINISGIFTTPDIEQIPKKYLDSLIKYCTAKEPLDVLCSALEPIQVTRIVIEDYSLPFTNGIQNQKFTIKAISDNNWDLLIPLDGVIN